MKNIFIEGLQGAGKSTLLEQLSRELPESHVCREGDYSPITSFFCYTCTARGQMNRSKSSKGSAATTRAMNCGIP